MIRKMIESDLEYLSEQDEIAALEVQYHGDVMKEEKFTAVDENGICHGVLYFLRHFTFNAPTEELNKIIPCIYTDEKPYFDELIEYATEWYQKQIPNYPDRNLCLVRWMVSGEIPTMQQYLHHGFLAYTICPILKHDLTSTIEEAVVPDGMCIRKLAFEPEEVERFIAATAEANHGTPDSINELWFVHGGGHYSIFVLMDGETIVSSACIWRITEERCAIENIFTATSYRQRGLAKVIIRYTLAQAKEEGYQFATLSMVGRNWKAAGLYQSLGFELFDNQIELIYKNHLDNGK